MVTLGLLPALAYERSALGQEVGIGGQRESFVASGHACDIVGPGDEVALHRRRVRRQPRGGPPAPRLRQARQSEHGGKPRRYCRSTLPPTIRLIYLARLRKGQRVPHSLGDGRRRSGRHRSGQARRSRDSTQTAGTESKRERLRALGVRAAFDSHSFDWYDELMTANRERGCRYRIELPCRTPHRAVPARAAGRRLALRNRKGRRLRRPRHRPAHLSQEPPLRCYRRGPPHDRRPASRTRDLADMSRPGRTGSAAPSARHHLPVQGLRQGPPPDDHGTASGKTGPEDATCRDPSRVSGRRRTAAVRSGSNVSGDGRAGRLRTAVVCPTWWHPVHAISP